MYGDDLAFWPIDDTNSANFSISSSLTDPEVRLTRSAGVNELDSTVITSEGYLCDVRDSRQDALSQSARRIGCKLLVTNLVTIPTVSLIKILEIRKIARFLDHSIPLASPEGKKRRI